ncbi:MAG: tRNA (N(6)-L-threonylcarbamoyladenosine(37)-C(2))-methylthiotransferase MtaB [Waddliaceae bacterium]
MSTSKKTFTVKTLGCRTNQYESQGFVDQLKSLGYVPAAEGEKADLCLVNSCTVTQSADSTSRSTVRQIAKQNPGAQVIVTGCSAEQNPGDFLSIEGVTKVVSNADKESIIASLFPDIDVPEFSIKNFDAHTRAFVKVQDGCNSYCSYCIIPYVRGRSRSRTIDEIILEVEDLVKNGYQEIVLTGINIGDFDGGGSHRLSDLVKAVDQVEGVNRVRISSIDPDEVEDDLLDAVINGKHTCPSMHIVLQSGSNVTLKRMNRKYTRQIFFQTIERLKNAHPDFTFTTDVIVGFPGETERDFEETLQVIQKTQFVKVHVFPFSPRKRTRAAIMKNQISPQVIKERKTKLIRAAEHIGFERRKDFIGREMVVLTESGGFGHTENFLPVRIEGEPIAANQLVAVKLIENHPDGLLGVRIENLNS